MGGHDLEAGGEVAISDTQQLRIAATRDAEVMLFDLA